MVEQVPIEVWQAYILPELHVLERVLLRHVSRFLSLVVPAKSQRPPTNSQVYRFLVSVGRVPLVAACRRIPQLHGTLSRECTKFCRAAYAWGTPEFVEALWRDGFYLVRGHAVHVHARTHNNLAVLAWVYSRLSTRHLRRAAHMLCVLACHHARRDYLDENQAFLIECTRVRGSYPGSLCASAVLVGCSPALLSY